MADYHIAGIGVTRSLYSWDATNRAKSSRKAAMLGR